MHSGAVGVEGETTWVAARKVGVCADLVGVLIGVVIAREDKWRFVLRIKDALKLNSGNCLMSVLLVFRI